MRHLRLGDSLTEFGDLGRLAFVAFAQLALDRGHLLAQQNFTIARVERRLGFAADLLGQPQHLDPVGEDTGDPLHAGFDVDGLQNILFLLGGRVHVGRHHVGKGGRRIDGLNCRQQFGRRLRQELDGLHSLSLEVDETRLDFV